MKWFTKLQNRILVYTGVRKHGEPYRRPDAEQENRLRGSKCCVGDERVVCGWSVGAAK